MKHTGSLARAKGIPLGRKGVETRHRLLDTGRKLILKSSSFDLTPAGICRDAELTPAAFYAYFANIAEFMFQLTELVTDEIESMDLSYLDAPEDLDAAIHKFIDEEHALQLTHRGIIQYRNAKSEQGEPRFFRLRTRAAVPRIEKIAVLIEAVAKPDCRAPRIDRLADAVFIYSAIESLCASAQQVVEKGTMLSWPKLRDAQIRLVRRILQVP